MIIGIGILETASNFVFQQNLYFVLSANSLTCKPRENYLEKPKCSHEDFHEHFTNKSEGVGSATCDNKPLPKPASMGVESLYGNIFSPRQETFVSCWNDLQMTYSGSHDRQIKYEDFKYINLRRSRDAHAEGQMLMLWDFCYALLLSNLLCSHNFLG